MISPLPSHIGYGFASTEPFDSDMGYRYESVGRYHNYYFTIENFRWPLKVPTIGDYVIDGFSPNLNKTLHIGHLRNLVVGSSIVKITNAKAVAMLGATLGVIDHAVYNLMVWYQKADYSPEVYYDFDMVKEADYSEFADGHGEYEGCKVTANNVVVVKSDKCTTYALHDIIFARKVKPTHYITGDEQIQHFKEIGLGDKHLPMGLVSGADGKKLKSRDGTALSADDAMELIENGVRGIEPATIQKLAWNILAWNFLSVKRTQNVKFIPELWANPDRGGLYITYTYARVCSALAASGFDETKVKDVRYEEIDIPLLGTTAYCCHYRKKAIEDMDACPIANYAFELAKLMGSVLSKQRVVGGTESFQMALFKAKETLGSCMDMLCMNKLDRV